MDIGQNKETYSPVVIVLFFQFGFLLSDKLKEGGFVF